MISVVIADDHQLIRDGWSLILNRDGRFKVVGTCADSDSAVQMSIKKKPDVVLMDINMPPFSGMEATRRILEASPDTHIIAVTMHSQPSYAKKMLNLGATGYVTKNSSPEEMVEAIVEVSQGHQFICAEMTELMSEVIRDPGNFTGVQALTEREVEVVNLVKQGRSTNDIAEKLNISNNTVEAHRHNILRKLKLKNTAALINFMNSNTIHI